MYKNCLHCNKLIEKKQNCSVKAWNERVKFCSKDCLNNSKIGVTLINGGSFKKGRKYNVPLEKRVRGERNNFWKGGQITKQCVICETDFKIDPYLKNLQKCCSKNCQLKYRKLPEVREKQSINARQQILEQYGKTPKFITSLQMLIRESAKYRLWREAVWTRDKYTCQICQKKGKICADHIFSFLQILLAENIQSYDDALNNSNSKLWDISNGRTLCYKCHYKTDNYGFKAIKLSNN